jgi:lysine-N-methylase
MNSNRIPEEPVPNAARRGLAANRTVNLPANLAANLPAASTLRRHAIGAASVPVLPSILPPGLPPILPERRTPPVKLPGRSTPRPPREYPRPSYSERFHCITSACEDTCCKDWELPVDKATYEKYRTVEALKPHLGSLIVLNTKTQTDSDFARIPLSTNRKCTFLDGEQMCGIQRQLGAEMLSVTCQTYPRAILRASGEREEALNLSCPEAARVALLAPDLLGECDSTTVGRADRYATIRRDARQLPRQYQPRLALREFMLLQLTDRSYPLWQRLYLLEILTRRLDALSGENSVAAWAAANPGAVAKLLSDSARVAVLQRLRPAMEEIAAQPSEQLPLIMELVRMRVSQPPVPTRFIECVQAFESGLGVATATSEEQILNAYAEGYRRYYKPLMEQHPHLLENYLLNHVFKNSLPFGRERPVGAVPEAAPDAEREHLSMCVHAALAQTLLIGMAGHFRESFGLNHVVKLVQSLARTVEHSPQFLGQISTFLREKNLNHPRGVALLLRQAD